MTRVLVCACIAGALLTGCASSSFLPAPAEGQNSPAVERQKAEQDARGSVDLPSQTVAGTAIPATSDAQKEAGAENGTREFSSGTESTILLAILLPTYYILILSGH